MMNRLWYHRHTILSDFGQEYRITVAIITSSPSKVSDCFKTQMMIMADLQIFLHILDWYKTWHKLIAYLI